MISEDLRGTLGHFFDGQGAFPICVPKKAADEIKARLKGVLRVRKTSKYKTRPYEVSLVKGKKAPTQLMVEYYRNDRDALLEQYWDLLGKIEDLYKHV